MLGLVGLQFCQELTCRGKNAPEAQAKLALTILVYQPDMEEIRAAFFIAEDAQEWQVHCEYEGELVTILACIKEDGSGQVQLRAGKL